MLRFVVWTAVSIIGVASLALAVAAVGKWRRERRLPELDRRDAPFFLGMGAAMAALVFLFAVGLLVGIERQREERAAFMEECVRYRPRFECTALWRAGNRDDPTIIPLPIPIPVR